MPEPSNRVLQKMLDRLFGAITSGPSLNCRPHSSRQRVDLTHLSRLADLSPASVLREILGDKGIATIAAKVPAPPPAQRAGMRRFGGRAPEPDATETDALAEGDPPPPKAAPSSSSPLSDAPPLHDPPASRPDPNEPEALRAARRAWSEQQALLAKLRVIAGEARTYEEDTGVYVLNIGFPLLSLPPGMAGGAAWGGAGGGRGAAGEPGSKRILAPIAFIPVSLTIKMGPTPSVEIECKASEIDRVSPNQALLSWLEQQTGRKQPTDLFADEEGSNPWRELRELVRHVCETFKITPPALFEAPALPESIPLTGSPRTDEGTPGGAGAGAAVLACAVLGLYPVANQGLIQDTQAMLEEPTLDGPVASFVRADVRLDPPSPVPSSPTASPAAAASGPGADARPDGAVRPKSPRSFPDERLVAVADPCQSRAVALARRCRALVIHGPPGTGKSQTITNIIGDHLSRSERVLFVCDKRTALDVVSNRLEHLGLGRLCALVHDPQRDQRDLYMNIREQLEALADTKTTARAEQELARVDEELASLHGELTQRHVELMTPAPGGEPPFHDLVGQWLAITSARDGLDQGAATLDPASLRGVTSRRLDALHLDIATLLRRADEVAFAANPWARCSTLGLDDFLARPAQVVRSAVAACVEAAGEADASRSASIPFFVPAVSLEQQAAVRARLAEDMERAISQAPAPRRALWAARPPEAIEASRRQMESLRPQIDALRAGAPDAELTMLLRSSPPDAPELARQLSHVETYLSVARKWYGFLSLSTRHAGAKVLTRYGLELSVENAQRVRTFLVSVRAMFVLRDVLEQWQAPPSPASPTSPPSHAPAPAPSSSGVVAPAATALPDHLELGRAVADTALILDILARTHKDASLAGMYPAVCASLSGTDTSGLVAGLAGSAPRAGALARLERAVDSSALFDRAWQDKAFTLWRRGRAEDAAADTMRALESSLNSLEDVLRVRDGLSRLPAPISEALRRLVAASTPAEESLASLRQAVLAAEIAARLESAPALRTLDARRMQTIFERYRQLEQKKTALVRDTILHRWVTRQKERLLATTGSRLNSSGADLRRRLTTRGKKAMRLRQVVAFGASMEGGDPLMDLRPVWMASPETVAQIFQRRPLFDVVIFDEASQCRLEEALPVLTRAGRVVIAGDPKQLPPTRFFESAIAGSDPDEIHTEQQLFEVHQGEIEDLLGAALSLDLERCYLDVHYRSRNSDLVAFSNQQFYGSRLQPIPGHPRNRTRYAPISMYRVDGVYDKRTNIAEAEQVCRIIRDLLRRADPPTIGVGCFNLTQRDLIIDKLDELASQDPDFAPRLAAARNRRGHGTFEGLFVKNLENVQGDERDHIIISTTYGPDPAGKFYKRFGPLAMPGGGRRLNVLVTRARCEVHLVTSIPREAYLALPPIPEGQTAGGGYLLFAYLNYAEQLAARYELAYAASTGPDDALIALTEAPPASTDTPDDAAHTPTDRPPAVSIFDTATPSPLAEALAHRLATPGGVGGTGVGGGGGGGGVASDVYWGNDGFCVDLALRHPARMEDVTIGVLCDSSRFALADDPVEWDVFRTSILEGQGWTLHRVWSPSIFHDLRGCTESILKRAAAAERATDDPDTIRVKRPPDHNPR